MRDDYTEELLFMKKMILEKYVFNELDIYSLLRMINRVEEISYFVGRLDGEKYSGGNKNEQNNFSW